MEHVAKEFVVFGMLIAWVTLGVYPLSALFGMLVGRWAKKTTLLDEGVDCHRMPAAQLVLLEYHLVEMTNALRIRRGLAKVDRRPIAADLTGHSWDLLRSKVRQAIQATMGRLAWLGPS